MNDNLADNHYPETNRADYDLLDTLSHLLRRSHFYAEALFAKQLGDYKITSRQLALMVAVAHNPGASQRTIGDEIALDVNTVSDLVRRMEKRGLVERQASAKDGRSSSIHLGAVGSIILNSIHGDNLRYQDSLTETLTAEEVVILKCLLRKMLGLCG